jgi:hypothetical protein
MMLAIFSELGPILAGHSPGARGRIDRDMARLAGRDGAAWREQLAASNFAAPEFLDAEGKIYGRSSRVSDNHIRDQRFRVGLRFRTKRIGPAWARGNRNTKTDSLDRSHLQSRYHVYHLLRVFGGTSRAELWTLEIKKDGSMQFSAILRWKKKVFPTCRMFFGDGDNHGSVMRTGRRWVKAMTKGANPSCRQPSALC